MAWNPRLVILPLLLSAAAICYGQEVRASISGSVTDPSGAPISGAIVIVTNPASNAATTETTNDTGTYLAPFLAPGTYVLTVEHPGFKRYVRENIVLQSLDKARIDIHLELGNLADSVTVSSSVSTLQTETATRGQGISNELVSNLPTQGRNPFQIMWAAPGVIKVGTWRYLRSFDSGGTSGFSINGGRNQENEVLLDGISDMQSNRSVINVPTLESIQEFKVLTNTYDAQYGRTGGGVITIVTKSGTNSLHGTLFENFQNAKLNANQSELNAAGIPKSPNHINAFGFQLDGPVLIPKVFNGRNRLFWLISYEGMRQRSADPGVATVPTLAERAGDFSGLFNAQGQQVLIYDPTTTAKDGSRTPFAGNKIPASRISPIAAAAFAFYPAPTSLGTGPAQINNYPFPSRWVGDLNQVIGRLDYQITSKNNVSFRYGQNPYSEYRGLVFVLDLSQKNPAEPTGNAPLLRNGRNWTWNWTSTISPSLTFDLRAGLNRWENGGGNTFGANYDPRKLGFDSALVSQFSALQFPPFNLGSYQQMGSSVINYGMNDTYSVQPNFNLVRGKHFLKFGVEARKYNDNTINPGNASGAYTFGKTWTQANASSASATSGNEIATFLLGDPTAASADRNINTAFTHFYYAGFFQDDWKLTSRLTVNLGLRWDYESPATERYNRMIDGLDLTAASPIASQIQGLSLKGAVLFAGVNGQPRGTVNPDKNNFAPRIGIAFQPWDKWVVRGGYGLYYLGQSATGGTNGFSQTTNAVLSIDGNLTPAVNLANAFALQPGGLLLSPIGSSQGAASFLGQNLTVNYRDRPLPYSQQYSFDIQRELRGDALVEIAYVGNQTSKLPLLNSTLGGGGVNLNYIPLSQMNQVNANGAVNTAYYTQQVPNPLAGLIPANASLNGATTAAQNLMYAYPQFTQSLLLASLPIGKQRYDAFQSKITKRFSDGLVLLASYSFSKTLQQVRMLNAQDLNLSNPGATKLVKEPADQLDIPQKFNLTMVYELPFGKGKKFANDLPKLANVLIGGWEVNTNITYLSGMEVAYPNAPQVQPGSAKLDNGGIAQWFNTALWPNHTAPNLTYTTRNFPYEFSNVRLPGYHNWDASVSKSFAIYERIRMQFRFEAVNALNHPWYGSIASVDVTNPQFGRLSPTEQNLPRFLKLGLNLQF